MCGSSTGMTILVSVGFWMFWPTVNALVQELTPDEKMLDSNSLMLAAVQGGWLLAGAVVGFVYNHIGLGGVLLIDCASYAASDRVRIPACARAAYVARPGAGDGEIARAPDGAVAATCTNSTRVIATSGKTGACC